MSAIPAQPTAVPRALTLERLRGNPALQAFMLLRVAFTVAPIVFGADKFANVLVNWERYLASQFDPPGLRLGLR